MSLQNVLDAHRHAVNGRQWHARPVALRGGICRFSRALGVQTNPGPDSAFVLVDGCEAAFEVLTRGVPASQEISSAIVEGAHCRVVDVVVAARCGAG